MIKNSFRLNRNSLKISNFKFKIFLLFAICYLLFATAPAGALTMSNSNFVVQMGTLDMAGGRPTSSTYKLGISVGQTAPGLFTGTNYKVRSGFQYISSLIKFRFSISETLIDFGSLTATVPVTRTNTLTVSNGSAFGYIVSATESSQLINPTTGEVIPNTTCDDGSCTTIVSGPWTGTDTSLTYGFGYRCDNVSETDCASGFSNSTYYKQFADSSKNESPQTVMSGRNVGKNKQVQITYKVNVSNTQPAGFYRNIITYVATPTFYS